MKKRFLVALCMAAAVHVAAQQRAPQNESIRQEDLRADLFFLAGDSMRGRLTDTEENRATADYIRSRFERLGLKGAGAERLVLPALQPDDRHARRRHERPRRSAPATAPRGISAVGQEFYPHRFSASGHASGRSCSSASASARRTCSYDDYNGDVKGKIVLALDHEPGERDPNSPFDGVVTSEPSTVVAQGAGRAGERRGRRCCSSATSTTIPAPPTSRRRRATTGRRQPPRILNYTLAAWADRIRIPVAQISPALAASLVAGTGKTFEELARSRPRRRAASTPLPLPGARVDLHTAVDRHIVPDRNVVALLEGQRSAAEERVGDRLGALRSQRRRRARRSSTAPTTTARASSRCSRSPRPTRWRRRTASGRSAACCSRPGTPRSAGCSAPGRTPSSRSRR